MTPTVEEMSEAAEIMAAAIPSSMLVAVVGGQAERAVLALRELEGLSYDEIAKVTEVPTGTVMSRLYHARRLLAQKLKDHP